MYALSGTACTGICEWCRKNLAKLQGGVVRFGFHAHHAMSFLDLLILNSWIVLRKARARYQKAFVGYTVVRYNNYLLTRGSVDSSHPTTRNLMEYTSDLVKED